MGKIDAHALNWHALFTDAVMFRVHHADQSSPDTITITNEVFDRLLAVVDAAKRADEEKPGIDELSAREQDGKHVVTLRSKMFGTVKAEGRSLLEAIANAK